MTLAATSSRVLKSEPQRSHHSLSMWHFLAGAFALMVLFLAFTPDGVAEPLQSVASWLVVGAVAAFAVTAIVKGLERLMDCEAD